MKDTYGLCGDILAYLKKWHTGAEYAVISSVIEYDFDISGPAVKQIVNKLRCEGHPVCSDANAESLCGGYYYAKNRDEINNTVTQLLRRTKKINDAAQGLVLSHQIFYDGTEGGL